MHFIELHDRQTRQAIHINISAILAIKAEGKGSVIELVCRNSDERTKIYHVTEPLETIAKQLSLP